MSARWFVGTPAKLADQTAGLTLNSRGFSTYGRKW
jgi:hypothetical protein